MITYPIRFTIKKSSYDNINEEGTGVNTYNVTYFALRYRKTLSPRDM